MKIIPVAQAMQRLPAICEEALSGEIIRFQAASGAELELTPITKGVFAVQPFTDSELASCYEDADWAAFENNCGQASE